MRPTNHTFSLSFTVLLVRLFVWSFHAKRSAMPRLCSLYVYRHCIAVIQYRLHGDAKKSDHIVLFYSMNMSRASHTRNIKIKTAQSSAKAADLSTCPYGAVVKFRLKFLDPDRDPDPHHTRTVCH